MSTVLLRPSRICMHRTDLLTESRTKSLNCFRQIRFRCRVFCCAKTTIASSRIHEGGTICLEGRVFRESMGYLLENIP